MEKKKSLRREPKNENLTNVNKKKMLLQRNLRKNKRKIK